jgi:DNA-binding response OmpR family regulator
VKSPSDSRHRKTVLIAEDNKITGLNVARALSRAGFCTSLIDDGIEALNRILETKPDLIVLDINLPRLEGYEICSMVRKTPAVRNTPILIISGLASTKDKLNAFELGADDYVTKPFNQHELIARVEAVLNRSKRRTLTPQYLDFANW